MDAAAMGFVPTTYLLFSQYDFKKEIREQAHRSLYRRLTLQGTLDERLSSFFMVLLDEL